MSPDVGTLKNSVKPSATCMTVEFLRHGGGGGMMADVLYVADL